MNPKFIYSLKKPISAFFLSLFFYSSVLYPQTELKFNLLSSLVLVPNLGVELPIADRQSAQLDVLGSFWDSWEGSALHINQTFLEYRFYSHPGRKAWFLGLHWGFGMFTLTKPDLPGTYGYPKSHYQSGRNMYYGITLGYKKNLSDRWAVEAFLGGGFSDSFYRGYLKKIGNAMTAKPDSSIKVRNGSPTGED